MKLTKGEMYMGVVAIIAIAFLILYRSDNAAQPDPRALDNARLMTPPGTEVPPMTSVMRQVLEKSDGFQLLVSYTDAGFEPSRANIKVGDTVRYVNNSSTDLWVASSGAVYPGSSVCGGSALDTCRVLAPREFWEFTFDVAGSWSFANNLDKSKIGTLVVQQ